MKLAILIMKLFFSLERSNVLVVEFETKLPHFSLVVRKPAFCIHVKTKTQISFAVTAKLISAFVFATPIVQSLFFLNPKFHASRHLL